jgi:uncharacterized membrane-anchored protein
MMLLSRAFERVSSSIASFRRGSVVMSQDEGRLDEVEGFSKSALMIIAALVLYIVGGLGYYAKAHVWDELTPQQKDIVIQSMVVEQQVL